MRLSASECLPHQVLSAAIERSSAGRVGGSVLGFVAGREAITQLLRLHKDIDLVIPRGSNAMVQHIMSSTRIPTLGHADGICHLYVDVAADLEKAIALTIDAKKDYPAACNAIETLLIHESLVGSGAAKRLVQAALDAQVTLYGGPKAVVAFGLPPAASLRVEYGALAMAVELVPSVQVRGPLLASDDH